MINLAPSPIDVLAESATTISKNIPVIGNATLSTDSIYITGRAGINFYCSPNPVAKVFFGASVLCGIMSAASSGTALVTSFAGILMAGWLGLFGVRGFNRLGKYILNMGNVTAISDLIY